MTNQSNVLHRTPSASSQVVLAGHETHATRLDYVQFGRQCLPRSLQNARRFPCSYMGCSFKHNINQSCTESPPPATAHDTLTYVCTDRSGQQIVIVTIKIMDENPVSSTAGYNRGRVQPIRRGMRGKTVDAILLSHYTQPHRSVSPLFACCKPSILFCTSQNPNSTTPSTVRCDTLISSNRISYSYLHGFSSRCNQPYPIHLRNVAYNKETIWR
ncbi:unnamed protein product [Ectocarpus fasciculatus]